MPFAPVFLPHLPVFFGSGCGKFYHIVPHAEVYIVYRMHELPPVLFGGRLKQVKLDGIIWYNATEHHTCF
jgi:hypothetical protein